MKCSKCNGEARKPYDLCDSCIQKEITDLRERVEWLEKNCEWKEEEGMDN